jgi:hypothetical protein
LVTSEQCRPELLEHILIFLSQWQIAIPEIHFKTDDCADKDENHEIYKRGKDRRFRRR